MLAYNVRNNDKLPQSIINRFKTKDNSNYNLRNNYTDFVLKKPKTNFMKKSITYLPLYFGTNYQKVQKQKGSVQQNSNPFLTVDGLSKNL